MVNDDVEWSDNNNISWKWKQQTQKHQTKTLKNGRAGTATILAKPFTAKTRRSKFVSEEGEVCIQVSLVLTNPNNYWVSVQKCVGSFYSPIFRIAKKSYPIVSSFTSIVAEDLLKDEDLILEHKFHTISHVTKSITNTNIYWSFEQTITVPFVKCKENLHTLALKCHMTHNSEPSQTSCNIGTF